jgi:AAA domain
VVDTAPISDANSFEFARAAHVGIVKPEEGLEPRVRTTWDEFVRLMTEFTVSDSKVGAYVCRPMGGDGSRCDANALPWPLLPLDLDELLPEDLSDLEQWCKTQALDLVLATTFSHTSECPRVRLWIRCSRAFTATEHLFLFKAFNQGAVFPFKLDPATAKPSQPIYLPRCPESRKSIARSQHYAGSLLDVDGLLRGYQNEMRARELRNEGGRFTEGKGVRTPGGMVDAFNQHFDVRGLIEAHGYKRKTTHRYTAPGSKSGRAAVTLHEWGLISFHEPTHDPLSARNDLNQPRVLDPFAVFAILEHGDDFIPAWKDAARIVREKGWDSDTQHQGDPLRGYEVEDVETWGDAQYAREMVVENLLEREGLVVATGQSNSGKTTVLQYLGLCVALGQPFGPYRTMQGRVLWIAGEDQYNAQLRVNAMRTEYGIARGALKDTYFVLPNSISIMQRDSIEQVHEAIARRVGKDTSLSLVLIDSKSMCWGGDDENSNDENARFVRDLIVHFRTKYGAATILTHHLTKSKEKEEQTARGASALINNMDHEWRFEMRATSSTTIMEPGSKLRIARWPEMRFLIKVVELSAADYPRLRNSQGNMPKISIAELSNAYGVSAKQEQENAEYEAVLSAMIASPIEAKTRKRANDHIARAMGKIKEGSSAPDMSAARDWVRHRLRKLQEQKLIDKDLNVSEAGRAFVEQAILARRVSEDAPEGETRDREPGEDDE